MESRFLHAVGGEAIEYSVERRAGDVVHLRCGSEHAVFLFDSQPEYHILAISSSYGGYAFAWSHPGPDFKLFIANIGRDYVCMKMVGRDREFDTDATAAVIRALIADLREAGKLTDDQAESEELHVDEFESQGGEAGFNEWLGNTRHLAEADPSKDLYHLWRDTDGRRSRDFYALYDKFWPLLKAELLREPS